MKNNESVVGLKNFGRLTTVGELRKLMEDEDTFPADMQIAYSTNEDAFPLPLPVIQKIGDMLDAIQDCEFEKAERLMAELVPVLPGGEQHIDIIRASVLMLRQRARRLRLCK